MFIHTPVEVPQIESYTGQNGDRVYYTPTGVYPSITTVLKVLSDESIKKWRTRVGYEAANKITKQAGFRGNRLHNTLENYIKNKPYTESFAFQIVKPYVDRINNIRVQEKTLWSDVYEVAGKCDCIADFDGIPSVIDFKTSIKEKRKEWISNYLIQTTFYAVAFEERTGIKIPQIVIIIAGDDGSSSCFVDSTDNYVDSLKLVIDTYHTMNDVAIA